MFTAYMNDQEMPLFATRHPTVVHNECRPFPLRDQTRVEMQSSLLRRGRTEFFHKTCKHVDSPHVNRKMIQQFSSHVTQKVRHFPYKINSLTQSA